MKSCEPLVSAESDYYIYSPSLSAPSMFFYPVCVGRFEYRPGYRLVRDTYHSFLLMYIETGTLTVSNGQTEYPAHPGEFVLLDCFHPHAYSTASGCTCLWCHFDGPVARPFYDTITGRLGCVISLPDARVPFDRLRAVYDTFAENRPVREPLLSRYLTDILTSFLLDIVQSPSRTDSNSSIVEEITGYIGEHAAEPLTNDILAARASMSPYHFIRIFKRETGFTPHEYLLAVRIDLVRYLLKNTALSIKEICFQTGFSSESVFCSAFKKSTGQTPSEYRNF